MLENPLRMQMELEIKTKCFYGHTFHIHKELIDYDLLHELSAQRFLIDENVEYNDLYPFFMKHDELVNKIEKAFPNIKWKTFGEFGYTKRDEAIIQFMIIPVKGKNEVTQNLVALVTHTDRPFDDLKDLCRTYEWTLWHLNSFQYLNVYDSNECEPDLLNFPLNEDESDDSSD
jgi:hypothetical protein